MKTHERLLLDNKAWAEEHKLLDRDYFTRLARIQKPEFLWIGCSDSRVPANEITNTEPGEVFVHRNIANLVVANDLNLLSVLEFSVLVLKVKHVIVCGHYGCGGVRASLTSQKLPSLDRWLNNLRDTYKLHHRELDALPSDEKKAERLTELSVEQQVLHLEQTSVIQQAWKDWKQPVLHGWVYRLNDGILHNLIKRDPNSLTDPV
jgi:carbonic anhydrase